MERKLSPALRGARSSSGTLEQVPACEPSTIPARCGPWHGALINSSSYPSTGPYGCGIPRQGAACESTKGTVLGAWPGAPTSGACCLTYNASMRLLDVESGQSLHVLDGHTDSIYCVAFDADHQRALSGSRDGTVRVWDLANGRCLGVLEGHTYHVHRVAWASDQRRALSCSTDIRLWDVEAGRCLRVFEGHTNTIRSVRWSLDERLALSASHDRTIRSWDVETGRCLRVLTGHAAGVVNAAFDADQRGVVSCDWKGGIRTWNLGNKAPARCGAAEPWSD